ncbi:MAG: LysM peptidoglycan-binding domain-containing protein [Deltaproteobacteria bacterium]|nr:LysM peptidoglycan-binding domain-containing protein [Deltaproteobacteria bacterium]
MIPMDLDIPIGHRDLLRRSASIDDGTSCVKGAGRRGRTAAGLFLALLLLSVPWCSPLSAREPAPSGAREDTARLVFQKTAGIKKTREYVVKKGEWITGIFRAQLGEAPVPYDLIRKLNPRIRDLNRIQPGQRIVLPTRESLFSLERAAEEKTPPPTYSVKEGDSISRIIIAELNTPTEDVLKTYRLLRQLNPEIENPNRLQAGQVLRLPRENVQPVQIAQPLEAPPATPPPPAVPPAPAPPPETALTESSLNLPPNAETLLGFIGPVIGRMKGSLTTMGSYFIPLQENAQITIDCTLIPVIELPDGTTLLLDFGNRLSAPLKGMIRQSWPNYAFLPAEELRDTLTGLQGIISRSRNYQMFKLERPLAVTPKQEILAYPDWVIAEKKSSGIPYRQGLFLLGPEEKPLPAEARTVLEKSGLVVMEIANGRAIDPPPPSASTAPVMPPTDLRGLKGSALAEQLLKAVGETTVSGSEVAVFDQTRDGFNLSVTADLLIQKGEKRFIVYSKRIPDQFIRTLKESGTELILIGTSESGRPLIERVLQGMNLPCTSGHFSFRIPEESGRLRFTTAFSALRTTVGGEPLYLIDFDMSADLLSLLRGRHAGTIIKY